MFYKSEPTKVELCEKALFQEDKKALEKLYGRLVQEEEMWNKHFRAEEKRSKEELARYLDSLNYPG